MRHLTTHASRLHAVRLLTAGALAGVLAAALAGCGSSGSDTAAGPGTSTASSTAPAAAQGTSSNAAHDTSAEHQAAAWITGQLKNGVLFDDQYKSDDYGTSADVALALAAIGGHEADVARIAKAVAAHQHAYVAPGFGTELSAGAVAKTIVLDQAAGIAPGALVGKLDTLIGSNGRVADKLDPKAKKATDYANTIVQTLAVRALDKAGDPKATAATRFLLAQQCADGGFRLYFPTSASHACTADVDTTGFAVLALLQAHDQPGASAAAAKAVRWLASVQHADGSFDASQPAVPNANSTGLAGWALGAAGSTAAAAKAATWVAKHELPCSSKDAGAIAYDNTALAAGKVTVKTEGQFRSATSQALPALQWLPQGVVSESC